MLGEIDDIFPEETFEHRADQACRQEAERGG